ncbi:hypothetical protein COK30_13750 [Bacillus cereus]|uniref:glycosyl hydrolase family 28-related protein n=1 Tax=Bacillus cereus TaxID=1396 RepID=UPI000BF49B8D|nr:right-handed parallel beta-helix repeat-containing protein [Bacillus cereus]PFR12607.1 hypothetical protein COK30_13750 [Bacillus cereus]
MAEIQFNVNLDLIGQYVPAEDITIPQENDLSVKFTYSIFNREVAEDLTGATGIVVSFVKPDGNIVLQSDGLLELPNKVNIVANAQAFTYVGKVRMQIQYKKGTKTFNTRQAFFWVERSNTSCQTVASSSFAPYLDNALAAGERLEGLDLQALVDGKSIAENAQTDVNLLGDRTAANEISIGYLVEAYTNVKSFGAIGDGITDDTTAIKQAISGLPNGGKITFPKGNYKISEPLVFKNKNSITIEILGSINQTKHGYCGIEIESCTEVVVTGSGKVQGYGTFPYQTFNGDGTVNNEKSRNGGGFSTTKRNGDIGAIPFGGGYEANQGIGILIHEGSENIKVETIEVAGFNYSGIAVGHTNSSVYNKNVIVTSCTIHDCQDNAISTCKTYGVNIDTNQIYNIGHPTASVNDTHINLGYGVTLLYWNAISENVVITGNNFNHCARKAVDAHACKNGLTISNNMIDNCYVYGIALPNNSPTTPWSDFSITGNTVRNSGTAPNYLPAQDTCCGIFADITVGGTIANNTITDSGRYGLYVYFKNYTQTGRSFASITGNTVAQTNTNALRGIHVFSDYLEAYANITGNTAQSTITTVGTYVGYLKSANIIGNTSQTKITAGSNAIGLQVTGVSEGSVSNNSCTGEIALSVQNGSKIYVDNSNICNGTYYVNSYVKELISGAYFIQKVSGNWVVTSRYNANITPVLSVSGNVFRLTFPTEFKVQADIGFMNGPIGVGQIGGYFFNNVGNSWIEIICHDRTFNQVNPTTVNDGTGFTLSLKFLWKSL